MFLNLNTKEIKMFKIQNKEKKMHEISKQLSLIDLEINKTLPKNKIPVFLKKGPPAHIETKVEVQVENEITVQPKTKGSVKILEIKKLSDQNLLFQTKYLVQKERNITIQVLRHLSEIESRKLHLKRGFASLFDYAVRDLGYSHSAAYRRIKVMKLCREVPEIVSKLKTGSLNLTTVSKLQAYFEKQDKKAKKSQTEFNLTNQEPDLLMGGEEVKVGSGTIEQECKNNETCKDDMNYKNEENYKSDNMTMECNPEKNLPATIKKNFPPAAGRVMNTINQKTKSDEPGLNETKKKTKDDESGLNLNQKLDLLEQVAGKSSRQTEKLLCEMDTEIYQIKDKIRYLNKDQIEIKLTVNKNSYENLETLKSLLSHISPNMSYGKVFQILSELGLNKYDPRRKLKKQNEKKKNTIKKAQTVDPAKAGIQKTDIERHIRKLNPTFIKHSDENCKSDNITVGCDPEKNLPATIQKNFPPAAGRVKNNKNASQRKQSRYIPAQIKRLVWTRDQGQCTYICPETKKKCGSKHFLQIDHIHPYSLGGSSELSNLRLLCAGHNQYRNKLFQ